MIQSKPKPNTLFALSTFVVLALAGAGFNMKAILIDANPAWFNYLIAAILLPAAGLVMLKVMWSYKLLRINKEKIEVRYPLRFINRRFGLSQLEAWGETIIKTSSGIFKELTLEFEQAFKVKLTHQENTEYNKILSYLQKKAPGKQRKDSH